VDSRGHGRSTRDARPYGYDRMADDVVVLLDTRHIAKADVVGWSDGAILGLDLAIRHPDRVGKVFAFAANTVTSGVQESVEKNPTFAAFIERAGHEYAKLSATPKDYDAFVAQISKMWENEPNWTDAQLQSIQAPVLVVDGDHDEAIKRAHTEYIAATIPGAGLLILPNTSHFAFLQDPTLFNAALLHFLGDRGDVPQNTPLECRGNFHSARTITNSDETARVGFSCSAQRLNTISSRTLMLVISTARATKS
jgi:pimeloyl-ACP methyl ester carboxylesterase